MLDERHQLFPCRLLRAFFQVSVAYCILHIIRTKTYLQSMCSQKVGDNIHLPVLRQHAGV